MDSDIFINGAIHQFNNNVYDFIGDKPDLDAQSWDYQWDVFRDLHINSQSYYPELEKINFEKHFELSVGSFSGKKILDAGAGTGRNAKMLRQNGAEVYAADASKSIFYQAGRDELDIKWIRTPLASLPFKDNFFDVILCDGVIPHVSGVSKALDEFNRVLSPDGLLLISYSSRPSRIFCAHNFVKVYRLFTKHMSYDNILRFSKLLSALYDFIQSKKMPTPIRKLLLGLIPDKSSLPEWRICYTLDRLSARHWNFYPTLTFKKYLVSANFNILKQGKLRTSFVCSKLIVQ